jgi:uncharacterized protein YkwD
MRYVTAGHGVLLLVTSLIVLAAGVPRADAAPHSADTAPGPIAAADATLAYDLVPGLNVVPFTGPDGATADALATALGPALDSLWQFDAATQRWRSFRPALSAALNTLTTLDRAPIFVRLRAPAQLAIPADPDESTRAVTLAPGYTFVSVAAGTEIASVLDQHPGLARAFGWDGRSQSWLTYSAGLPSALQSFDQVYRPDGLFVLNLTAAPVTVQLDPVGLDPGSPPPLGSAEVPTGLGADEALMVDLVNAERSARGLPPLRVDLAMVEVARAHSTDMATRDFFSHVNPDGLDPFERMRAAGITFGAAAENIAMFPTTTQAHEALMASDGHRRNILGGAYRRIGIGVFVDASGQRYFTQVFAD